MIQASYIMGSNASGVCFGDSGGPILLTEGGTWVQADVTENPENPVDTHEAAAIVWAGVGAS